MLCLNWLATIKVNIIALVRALSGFSFTDDGLFIPTLYRGLRANGTKTYVKEIIHCLNVLVAT